jgi:hypothetical protein
MFTRAQGFSSGFATSREVFRRDVFPLYRE